MNYEKKLDITKFNPKEMNKSELQKELEENSISPLVGFLAHIVDLAEPNENILRYSTSESLKNCNDYLKQNNHKLTN